MCVSVSNLDGRDDSTRTSRHGIAAVGAAPAVLSTPRTADVADPRWSDLSACYELRVFFCVFVVNIQQNKEHSEQDTIFRGLVVK